jgi:hypothetical protein
VAFEEPPPKEAEELPPHPASTGTTSTRIAASAARGRLFASRFLIERDLLSDFDCLITCGNIS